jgi:hypothetical protein
MALQTPDARQSRAERRSEVVKHALRGFGLGIACLLLTTASAFAQLSTAQLSGRVTDQHGDVVPGANVTAIQIDTGYTRTSATTSRAPCSGTRPPV